MPSQPDPDPSAALIISKWFTEELQPHEPLLRSWLHSNCPVRGEVDDVVQESFLRVWRVRTAEPIHSAKAFLFRVARNVVIDLLRRQRNSPVEAVADLAALPVADECPDAVECLTADEILQLLADAIAALPPRRREVMLLCKIHGLTHREAAGRLGLAPKTVDEHISRGLKQLGTELRTRGLETHF
jgi:RNA polymerase sigma factor (sigma-70 family)